MFPSFFFFLLSAFFALVFSSLPLLFDILKPKICPPDEVFGIYIYSWVLGLHFSLFCTQNNVYSEYLYGALGLCLRGCWGLGAQKLELGTGWFEECVFGSKARIGDWMV